MQAGIIGVCWHKSGGDGDVGSSNVNYDGMHGGFGYGARNVDGSSILEFTDGINLVICNTLFMKQQSKLVICSWFCKKYC